MTHVVAQCRGPSPESEKITHRFFYESVLSALILQPRKSKALVSTEFNPKLIVELSASGDVQVE